MSSFVPDIPGNAPGGIGVQREFKKVLEALEVKCRADNSGAFWSDYTPGSYDPIRVKFFFPRNLGILAVEGLLMTIAGQPTEDLRLAINFLNAEVPTYRFYVSEGDGNLESEILVRYDLLPNTESTPAIHPRELRQILTGLCAQKAIFADTLVTVQGGRSWRMVKDALRAVR
jgi:hypothetical protein